MTTTVIGDLPTALPYWGEVAYLKQETVRLYGKVNPNMQTWKQLSPTVKVWIKMVMGKPFAYVYTLGELYSFGSNFFGQLGLNDLVSHNVPTFINSGGFTEVSAGAFHVLALKGSELFSWGINADGELGLGDFLNRSVPTLVGAGYKAISAGGNYSLAIKENGDLYAWGDNTPTDFGTYTSGGGNLGTGDTISRNVPTLVGSGYKAIAAGTEHSLALKENGDLYFFGDNSTGQGAIGFTAFYAGHIVVSGTKYGDAVAHSTPMLVTTGVTAIAAGGSHTLVLKGDSLYSAGLGTYGQLGFALTSGVVSDDGTVSSGDNTGWTGSALTALKLVGTGYTAISSGNLHSLALKDTDVYTCGYNSTGQLGTGDVVSRYAFTNIGTGYKKISAGGYHSFGVKKNSDLYAWGYNIDGQLGIGDNAYGYTIPQLVGNGYKSAHGGGYFSLAMKGAI